MFNQTSGNMLTHNHLLPMTSSIYSYISVGARTYAYVYVFTIIALKFSLNLNFLYF